MNEQPRRPRHLMDPDNPIRPVNDKSLTHVKQWVASVLVVFTVAHLVVGLVIGAVAIDPVYQSSRVGLCVIAAGFGVLGLAGGFLIHRRSPFTPWLLLGLLPSAVGLWLVLR
ncbi:hypothetical protein ACIA03_19220 [Nocardioides sp. NPDC051685]|uniref:hypothetical protein n=1 Tax=Nocardioides sp. NPDC051685 TaxID=3364334 RepID=UPI00378DBF62